MAPVTSFTIVYDAACGLCTRAKDWINQQTPLVGLRFVAAGSPEARRRFPQLPPVNWPWWPTQEKCGWGIAPGSFVYGRSKVTATLRSG